SGGRVLVAGLVDTPVFLGEVEAPVGVEVTVGDQGTQLEDGLGAVQTPAGAGDVQPVADQVAAGAFDHAGGDRPAAFQGGVVAEELPLGGQVTDTGVDSFALVSGQASVGGLVVERGDDAVDVAGKEPQGVAGDPGFGGRVGVGVETPGGLPQVLQDVDEVDQDLQDDAAACCFGLDQVELVAGGVDKHNPGRPGGGVALVGLVEARRDDLLAGGGDRAGQPLGGRDRPGAPPPTARSSIGPGRGDAHGRPHDVVVSARSGGGVVDGAQRRHPLAALLLAASQPGLVATVALDLCGLAGG